MRLRRRFLFKLAVLVVASLFVIPLLLHYLDDSQREELEKGFLRLRNRIRESRFVSPAAALTHGAENVMRNPLLPIQNSSSGLKVYGPRTFFKEGQIGNYELVEKAASIFGPGEMGEPVYTSMNEKQAADQSIQEYGFNMVASDKVSLDRVVPDTRMEECKFWHYPKKLPTTSVIIVFHNEGWSTLLRTVHSVINMSPPSLLHEIVMVDDMSDKENLKEKLEKYILRFNGKVKLYRNKERGGLIRTRTRGAKYATGDVIVFLDAHCECNRNWLPPLLARIAYDRTIMAVPIVESVDWNNFRYRPVYTTNHHRGIFEWGFLYKESQVPQKELKRRLHHSEPYWSPTHAGGLFAMDRKYFFELGGYDPGLQIWGGENFELSFKIWQCGGSIEWVPCSRVGHIYRNHMPYGFGNISFKIPIILLNYMRVVEVWLDDKFKEYFYTREPSIRGYPVGNITEQLEFKKSHKCKSFQWFMDNIAYEVFDRFPPLPPNSAWGEIKLLNTQKCWDSHGQPVGGGPIGISVCHHLGGNQLFRLNNKGQLAMGERCIEAVSGDTLSLQFCETEPTGPWDWDKDIGLIVNKDYNRCVEPGNDNKLHLKACDIKSESQQWEINEVRSWQ